MKSFINLLGLALISSFLSSQVLAQFMYPDASFFAPAANLYRGAKTDPFQWLEKQDAQVIGFLLSTSNLREKLAGDLPVTLIAPSDQAFSQLPVEIRDRLSQPGQMEKLLKYHLIPQFVAESDVKQGQVGTLEGHAVEISGRALSNQNTEIRLNEAVAERSISLGNNLVVILVDQVLIPPSF